LSLAGDQFADQLHILSRVAHGHNCSVSSSTTTIDCGRSHRSRQRLGNYFEAFAGLALRDRKCARQVAGTAACAPVRNQDGVAIELLEKQPFLQEDKIQRLGSGRWLREIDLKSARSARMNCLSKITFRPNCSASVRI
jgi:hypothetical protein